MFGIANICGIFRYMAEMYVERLEHYSDDDAADLGRLMPHLSARFTSEPIDKKLLETIINSPFHDQLVARLDGRIVGAATLSLIMGAAAGRKGYLEDFVADPDVRRQGIGKKVWDEMMNWCRERNVDLGFTSHVSREAAHNFYHAQGAVIRDTSVFHVDVVQE